MLVLCLRFTGRFLQRSTDQGQSFTAFLDVCRYQSLLDSSLLSLPPLHKISSDLTLGKMVLWDRNPPSPHFVGFLSLVAFLAPRVFPLGCRVGSVASLYSVTAVFNQSLLPCTVQWWLLGQTVIVPFPSQNWWGVCEEPVTAVTFPQLGSMGKNSLPVRQLAGDRALSVIWLSPELPV